MAESKERTLHERETLLFPTAEEARGWTEQVGERIEGAQRPGVRREREVVREALAAEFEKQGEVPGGLTHPWEHSEAEHAEVQQLVDVTFEKDLGVALRQARRSDHYPRNIDLFHDVLTAEMYDTMRAQRVNRQPVGVGLMMTVGVIVLMGLVVLLVISA